MVHHGVGQGADPHGAGHEVRAAGACCRELLVGLGEQGHVALHDPARHLFIARPRGVLDQELVGTGGRARGGGHGVVVRGAAEDDRGALRLDGPHGGVTHTARDVDAGAQAQQGGHAGDGAAVVAVRGGDDRELGGARGAQTVPQALDRDVLGGQPDPLGHGAAHGPRGTEDLEGRQAQAVGLVLDEHPADAELRGQGGQLPQGGGGVAGHAAVQLVGGGPPGSGAPLGGVEVEVRGGGVWGGHASMLPASEE